MKKIKKSILGLICSMGLLFAVATVNVNSEALIGYGVSSYIGYSSGSTEEGFVTTTGSIVGAATGGWIGGQAGIELGGLVGSLAGPVGTVVGGVFGFI